MHLKTLPTTFDRLERILKFVDSDIRVSNKIEYPPEQDYYCFFIFHDGRWQKLKAKWLMTGTPEEEQIMSSDGIISLAQHIDWAYPDLFNGKLHQIIAMDQNNLISSKVLLCI